MPLKMRTSPRILGQELFIDEFDWPHPRYTLDDVQLVSPRAAKAWNSQKRSKDTYFCVCYEELCAFIDDIPYEKGLAWDGISSEWKSVIHSTS